MKRVIKYLITIFLVLIGILQIYFYSRLNDEEKNGNDAAAMTTENYYSLSDINRDLDELSEKDILSADKENDIWKVKIKISGDKEKILTDISKLKQYNIESYIINKNKEENYITLELKRKNVKINL